MSFVLMLLCSVLDPDRQAKFEQRAKEFDLHRGKLEDTALMVANSGGCDPVTAEEIQKAVAKVINCNRMDGRTDGWTDRQTDRQRQRQTDRQTDGQTNRQTDGQTDGWMDGQTGRRTDRQRWTDKFLVKITGSLLCTIINCGFLWCTDEGFIPSGFGSSSSCSRES